jgi:hypothetical protein
VAGRKSAVQSGSPFENLDGNEGAKRQLADLYYDAVVELDPLKLLQKIEAAQKAIGDRLREAHPITPLSSN